jgi:hypothetical protein
MGVPRTSTIRADRDIEVGGWAQAVAAAARAQHIADGGVQRSTLAWKNMGKAGGLGILRVVTRPQDDEPVRLARELADAVAAGDHRAAIKLIRRLEPRLDGSRRSEPSPGERPEPETLAFPAPPSVVRVRRKPQSNASVRQAVISALAEIGVPCRAKLVAEYVEARFGQTVEPRAFAGLRRDERRTWSSTSARPAYIVPALEGRFYQPIRGLLALSDWLLERRLVGPWSERADHLAATTQLARQLAWLNGRDAEAAKRLAPVVASMARSIPGAVDGREVDTARVEAAAEAEREVLAERDRAWRSDAASRARVQLSEEQQLWGATVGVVVQGDG